MASKQSTSGGDPLGKPVATFDARLKAMAYLAAGVLLAVGGTVLLIVGLGQNDDNSNKTMNLILGGLLLVGGLPLVGNGVWNFRSGFEVRRKGVRYRSWGGTTEMPWSDVKRIEVTNYVRTDLGGNPDARIVITGRNKTRIVLGKGYMRLVKSPTMLVRLLEENSGLNVLGAEA